MNIKLTAINAMLKNICEKFWNWHDITFIISQPTIFQFKLFKPKPRQFILFKYLKMKQNISKQYLTTNSVAIFLINSINMAHAKQHKALTVMYVKRVTHRVV